MLVKGFLITACCVTADSVFAGHILYHGPREEVMDFFNSLGFGIPKRKGIPDFLQEVSGRKDQQVSSSP